MSVHQLFSDELPDEARLAARSPSQCDLPDRRNMQDLALGSVLETRRRQLQRRQRPKPEHLVHSERQLLSSSPLGKAWVRKLRGAQS